MGFAGILRQSTAVDVLIGPFVDSGDGDSEEAGLTISQADVLLSKNGQPAAQKNDNTTCAADLDGFYNCELDATDTNTVGQLTLYVHEAGALAVRHDFQIIEEAVYDIMFAASATGAVPVASIAAGAITAAAIATDAIDDDAIATGAIASTAFAAGAINAAAIATDAIGAAELADGAITAATFAAGAIDAAAIATDAIGAAELADGAITAATFAAGAIDAAAIAANAIDAATFAADVDAEILSYVVDDATRIDASALNTHSAITNATTADAVWDEDATGHQTGGTFGQAIGDPVADTNTIFKAVVTDATGVTVGVDVVAVKAETAAILDDTDDIGVAGAGLTALASQTSVTTIDDLLDSEIPALTTSVAAIKAKTDSLTFTVANQVDANALTVDEDEILDDALTDSVPADGALPTVRQALYMIVQFLTERAVAGTTVTVNKVDGTTALMTFTLSDATNPASITRAT